MNDFEVSSSISGSPFGDRKARGWNASAVNAPIRRDLDRESAIVVNDGRENELLVAKKLEEGK